MVKYEPVLRVYTYHEDRVVAHEMQCQLGLPAQRYEVVRVLETPGEPVQQHALPGMVPHLLLH
jgi:hypothetical protein